ncbi:MAG: hypothetical protein IPN17_08345 [Deltaproteobacteria bacterium]|nr:hypothetical protein [Deltaproteobacteria bacterium]
MTVLTFGELLRKVLPSAPAVVAPLAARITVLAQALAQAPRKFTPWDKHPEELFGELHAWIAGAALPTPFQRRTPSGQLLAGPLRLRVKDPCCITPPATPCRRCRPSTGCFGSWATRGGPAGRSTRWAPERSPPKVFAYTDAVFVDVVQDLTLVEIALLAALVSGRERGPRWRPRRDGGGRREPDRARDGLRLGAPSPTPWPRRAGAGGTFDLLGNVALPGSRRWSSVAVVI